MNVSPRSFLSKFFFYGVAFHLWSTLILSRFDDDDDTQNAEAPPGPGLNSTGRNGSSNDHDKLVDGQEEEEDEQEEDALFVPLTWSWLEEGEMYTASDPEWQQFVQISRDRNKLQSLRGQSLCAADLNNV